MEACYQEVRFPTRGEGFSEGRLVRWLVPDGGDVSIGQPLFEAETGGEVRTISCQLNGRLEKLAADGDACRSREPIGRVELSDSDHHVWAVKLHLRAGEETDAFDARRGDRSREKFARDAFLDFLNLPPDNNGGVFSFPPYEKFPVFEDSDISCPVLALEADGAHLVRWLIPDGEHVYADQLLYEAEVNGEIFEIPSFSSGFVRHGVADGTFRKIGESFGEIMRHEDHPGMCSIPLRVRHSREFHVFRKRNSETRFPHEQFVREAFLGILGLPKDEEGRGPRKS